MTYRVNANVNTKCSKSEDGKHAFTVYGMSGAPECEHCGISADKY